MQYHCNAFLWSFVVWSYLNCVSLRSPKSSQASSVPHGEDWIRQPRTKEGTQLCSKLCLRRCVAWMAWMAWMVSCGAHVDSLWEQCHHVAAWLKPHLNIFELFWITGTRTAADTTYISLAISSLASPRYLAKSGLSKLLQIRVSGAEAC